ncbi:hypothetical protein A3860_00265 [Niastella vici]|uniref:Fibronectin type-III domain-containing protein n=1 Tax=Niastella vici TaxID=1703345 RepID=A0A1V9G859_9BACT|nr:RICIN domain-containing protein [Niastella vici]OQP66839.1 hypothetical protein A3860_00265 [Niastella vici]
MKLKINHRQQCFLHKVLVSLTIVLALQDLARAQTFVHPGGLHTQADLDRMKSKVAASTHPWIDDWNLLITDSKAQNTYGAAPRANMGANRQRADADAHAAYLNAIRWYISGDTTFAECAKRNLDGWSAAVNQVPTGTDIPGLMGIAVMDFALAAEVLRIYPHWADTSFTRFKTMMNTYLYPVCHDFLTNHNGTCGTHYFANWDACNVGALISMGVLLDDTAKFNEGVTYYKSGVGNGNIMNAVTYIHPNGMGQWQESGRDQAHAMLGLGFLAYACQVAYNQGIDIFSYSSNRLLAGAEYNAAYNLWKWVPYEPYVNCDGWNLFYPAINGHGHLDNKPIFELLYNHYAVLKGLSAPNVKSAAQIVRPEVGDLDHLGYGTLTFTLDATASPYPPSPVAPVPTGVTAIPGMARVFLKWASSGVTAQGYNVLRATTSGGPYTTIASWTKNTYAEYTDENVTAGTTYYYVIQSINQSGTSANSTQVSATPVTTTTLPSGWARQDIGTVSAAGSAGFANVGDSTFIVSGSGTGIGGTADSYSYAYTNVSGDVTITARMYDITGTLLRTGLLIRESLNANAAAVAVTLGESGWRYSRFGARTATGGSMGWNDGNQFTWTPVWFRLQRSGNTFTAYQSLDGAAWFQIGTTTITMATSYYIGLAACSGSSTGAIDSTHFDNVSLIAGTPQPIPNGLYKIVAKHSAKVLDVYNNGTANGTNVQQYTWNDCSCQKWTVTYTGSGKYSIVGLSSGKYLDVAGVSTADGANIQIWQSTGGDNQRFSFTPTSEGYYRITPVHSGKAVDVNAGSTADGANVQQWTYLGGDNQQWMLVPVTASTTQGTRIATEPTATIPVQEMASNEVIIYPNPTITQLTVKLASEFENGATATLTDVTGRVLKCFPVSGKQYVLKLSDIPSGVYFIKVSNNTKSVTKKFIKK